MKSAIVFLLLITAATSSAQWKETNGPGSRFVDHPMAITCFVSTQDSAHTYLFAGTDSGIYRTSNDGQTWELVDHGIANHRVNAFVRDGNELIVGTNLDVYGTSDNGETWSKSNYGLYDHINALAVDSTDPKHRCLIAGTTQWGICRSTDSGGSWVESNRGMGRVVISSILFQADSLANSSGGAFSYTDEIGSVTCGGGTGYLVGKKSDPHPLDELPPSVCGHLRNAEYQFGNNGQFQMSYDTGKLYVEKCPHDRNSFRAFSDMSADVYGLGNTDALRADYLAWLEKVLYLNTIDPYYFCECVLAIAGTLPIPNDTAAGHVSRATNLTLSVYRWLLLNTTCDSPALWKQYQGARRTQYEQWQNDPLAYKLDTTLPPLSTWGLDTLLAKHFLYLGAERRTTDNVFGDVSASPNPARDETQLHIRMKTAAYVQAELYNAVGERTEWDGFEAFEDVGLHSVAIPLSHLPSGTYYARVETSYGEVKTVKVVKE